MPTYVSDEMHDPQNNHPLLPMPFAHTHVYSKLNKHYAMNGFVRTIRFEVIYGENVDG